MNPLAFKLYDLRIAPLQYPHSQFVGFYAISTENSLRGLPNYKKKRFLSFLSPFSMSHNSRLVRSSASKLNRGKMTSLYHKIENGEGFQQVERVDFCTAKNNLMIKLGHVRFNTIVQTNEVALDKIVNRI